MTAPDMEGIVEALRATVDVLESESALLDAWAKESREGGWSTHQVDPMRRRADNLRRKTSQLRTTLAAYDDAHALRAHPAPGTCAQIIERRRGDFGEPCMEPLPCPAHGMSTPAQPAPETALQRVASQVLDALESDATLDQRRDAFDALRDLVFPAAIPPEPAHAPGGTR